MSEPLFWNPLSDCAIWLSKRTGREMDARAVVDLVAQMGKQGNPIPTIIGVPLPPERGIVRVMMIGHPEWDTSKTAVQCCTVQMTEQQFGPPPSVFKYLEQIYPTFQFLCVSNLMQLLIYGRFDLFFVGDQRGNPHEMAVIMPWNAGCPVTVDACGIKRDDLLALGERLAPSLPPATIQPAPAFGVKAPATAPPVQQAAALSMQGNLGMKRTKNMRLADAAISGCCSVDDLLMQAQQGIFNVYAVLKPFSADGRDYAGRAIRSAPTIRAGNISPCYTTLLSGEVECLRCHGNLIVKVWRVEGREDGISIPQLGSEPVLFFLTEPQTIGINDIWLYAKEPSVEHHVAPDIEAGAPAGALTLPPAGALTLPPAEVPQLRQQERKILEWLKAKKHDAQSLPKRKNGHRTVKAIAKAALDGTAPFEGITTFEKAWGRLREGKEIQEEGHE